MNNIHSLKNIRNIIAAISVAMMFFACKNKIETVAAIEDPKARPSNIVMNLNSTYSDSCFINMRFLSSEVLIYDNVEEPYWDFPQGLTVYKFNSKGDTIFSVTAKYAIYYEPKGLWEARNNVVVVSENGRTLYTELLYWNTKEKRIYTDQNVKLVDSENTLYGKGLESDEAMTDPKFTKGSGSIFVEDKKKEEQKLEPVNDKELQK